MQHIALKAAVKPPENFYAVQNSVDMARIRSERFEKTLKSNIQAKGHVWSHGTGPTWLADMLADAFHWCDVNGFDPDFVVKLARSHHESEKLEDVMRKTANQLSNAIAPMSQTTPH